MLDLKKIYLTIWKYLIFSSRKYSVPGVCRGQHEQHDGGLGQDQGHPHPHCRHRDLHIRQQVTVIVGYCW